MGSVPNRGPLRVCGRVLWQNDFVASKREKARLDPALEVPATDTNDQALFAEQLDMGVRAALQLGNRLFRRYGSAPDG